MSASARFFCRIIDELDLRCSKSDHPFAPNLSVIETLKFFLREGVQWRVLQAMPGHASGSTLRRRLKAWSKTGIVQTVQARLIKMVRSDLRSLAEAGDVIVDRCSVRAKRGGALIGPNPTDRAKVNGTVLLPHLLRLALVVCSSVGRLFADAGYDTESNRAFCLSKGVLPLIRNKKHLHGSRLGKIRYIVQNTIAWLEH